MNTTTSTVSSDGVEGVESLTRKCCIPLNLGECPEWIDGLETGATPGQGATPAQQSCGGSGMAASFGERWLPGDHCMDLVAEANHGRDVAVAALSEQLDAANARIRTLEAECVAWRKNVHPSKWADDFDTFVAINTAKQATGPIGGVA